MHKNIVITLHSSITNIIPKNVTYKMTIITLLLWLLISFREQKRLTCPDVVVERHIYNVQSLGARPDGKTDSTNAFNAAWAAACDTMDWSTIVVPTGRFLVQNPIIFSGNGCKNNKTVFAINGIILGPTDYRVLGNSTMWLSFEDVDGLTVSGGVVDGQGAEVWACKRSGYGGCPLGLRTLNFMRSTNIVLDGLTALNSPLYHIVIYGCNNVKVHGVTVSAPSTSPNTDGIHVQRSTNVTILNSKISTGDDCISIGAGTSNLWIEGIHCGPGHGVSIGSLGRRRKEDGVQNVTVKTSTFTNAQNGVRIKTWAKQSNGFVRNVLFQNLTMVNSKHPIIISQNYCPHHKNCPKPNEVSGVKISNVTYQDIHGTSSRRVAVTLKCSSMHRCTGIKLQNVQLTYGKKLASTFCINAIGSVSGSVQAKGCL